MGYCPARSFSGLRPRTLLLCSEQPLRCEESGCACVWESRLLSATVKQWGWKCPLIASLMPPERKAACPGSPTHPQSGPLSPWTLDFTREPYLRAPLAGLVPTHYSFNLLSRLPFMDLGATSVFRVSFLPFPASPEQWVFLVMPHNL